MSHPRLTLSRGQLIPILAASLSAVGAIAQTAPSEPTAHSLDTYVVSATRTAQDPQTVSAAVDRVSLPDMETFQVTTLSGALASIPGVIVAQSGATGAQTSVFLRGTASHHTLFIVDGVRWNDRSSPYTNVVGAAELGGIDRLEVLRGPQSTLYGSSAIGGIILLDTTHGTGQPSGAVGLLAGSDSTFGADLYGQGASGPMSASLQVARFQTENERSNNAFEQWSGSGRVEYQAMKQLAIGSTFRVQENEYEEPGSRFFASNGNVRHNSHLFTAYADARLAKGLSSKLVLASHERSYRYEDDYGTSQLRNRRRILDWQTSWQVDPQAEIIAGANVETSRYRINGVTESDRTEALFVSGLYRALPNLTLNAGARYDTFKTFGEATTGRFGAAWAVHPETKLRASYGTGFSAPGVDDRYGVAAWGQLPNPDLQAEKAKGWDVGIDHNFGVAHSTASLTYFHNRVRNLFEWEYVDLTTYSGRIVNRARATTEGLEAAFASEPIKGLHTRFAYTYLDARDAVSGVRLIRRPHHTFDAEISEAWTRQFEMGLGARLVAGRFDQGNLPSYTTVRIFAAYSPLPRLTLKLRVENLFDRAYEDVLGYPALSRQLFGTVEWTF